MTTETEGLSFGMASPQRYKLAIENAGFNHVRLRDRNAWYAALSRQEYD
jgi:phosphoethanolamine N-methyltransferase